MDSDELFLFDLAKACVKSDYKFNKWNEIFKNEDNFDILKDAISKKTFDKLHEQAIKGNLNIYLQNILVMA